MLLADGFSLYIVSYTCTALLIKPSRDDPSASTVSLWTVAMNIFRIFLYYGEAYRTRRCHWAIPTASFLGIVVEFWLIALYLSKKPWKKPRGSLQQASAFHLDSREVERSVLDFRVMDIWLWTDFLSYAMFTMFFVVLLLLFTGFMLPQPPPLYLTLMCFGSALKIVCGDFLGGNLDLGVI